MRPTKPAWLRRLRDKTPKGVGDVGKGMIPLGFGAWLSWLGAVNASAGSAHPLPIWTWTTEVATLLICAGTVFALLGSKESPRVVETHQMVRDLWNQSKPSGALDPARTTIPAYASEGMVGPGGSGHPVAFAGTSFSVSSMTDSLPDYKGGLIKIDGQPQPFPGQPASGAEPNPGSGSPIS